MLSRDLEGARYAYELNDTEASRKAHLNAHKKHEKHAAGGNVIKSFVYGGLDGILTTFSIVAGTVGSSLGASIVVVLGISNVISDGLSMASGDYLSTKSEIEYQKAERAREEWEVENNPEGEMLEMEEIYTAKGMNPSDAKLMSQILAKNKEAWVSVMMVEELGIIEENDNPLRNGLVTFFSFIFFGSFPLIPFLIGLALEDVHISSLFYSSLIVTLIVLFFLGAVKTKVTGVSLWKSGGETLLIGAIAASAAYMIGWALEPIHSG